MNMTVTDVRKDPKAGTMTITTEFAAAADAVWQLWADPRKLERWWGPPTYPATVLDHDLTPGGTVNYLMTGPEGDQPRGYWRVLVVEAARRLEFEDGFADGSGTPNPELPVTRTRVTLEARAGGGTQMVIESTFPSTEAMEQMVAMGMEEGMREALGQIDAILGEAVPA
jgi:uncharacterized protein YndB with AHSA1/START domain